jgi:transposase
LLGLGLNWEVVEVHYERAESEVRLEIRETNALWQHERCPSCTGQVRGYDHVEPLLWRHLNVFEHECQIRCRLPRGRCRQCGHTYRVRPPWEGLSKHFTTAFEAFALLLMREMPVAQAAETLGETDRRLWRMLLAHVECAYAEADFSQVTCVGVDELSRKKGHRYLTLFADLIEKRVLFATHGKDHQTWAAFCQALGEHNGHPHALRQVSLDMSPAYMRGVREHCRNAEMVFDKFHVIAQANQAVDRVRRTERRRGNAAVRDQLQDSQWLWRKNPENLTERQQRRLERIDHQHLCTAKAYQMRLTLQEIYALPCAVAARRRFCAWCRWVRRTAARRTDEMLAPMLRVATMIERHLAGILAHWKHRVTNAWMEALNGLIQAIKRKARGYRTIRYLTAIIYFVAGNLRLPAT